MLNRCKLQKLVEAKGGSTPFLGLGTVKFGRSNSVKYPKSFILPSDDQIKNILNVSYSCGIRLLDTAPAYGVSENVLGRVLRGVDQDWVIGTKVGEVFDGQKSSFDFTADFTFASVENSLRNLRVNVLDYVLIHSNGDDINALSMGVVGALRELQRKGTIRLIGISCKSEIGCIKAIECGLDIIMVDLTFQQKKFTEILKLASKNNISVIIKKPFNSGFWNPRETFNRLSTVEGLSGVVFGSIDIEHIKQNAKLFFQE